MLCGQLVVALRRGYADVSLESELHGINILLYTTFNI